MSVGLSRGPEPLGSEHDVSVFASGVPELDLWLQNHALRNQETGASRVFVLYSGARVIGYYSLSAGSIVRESWPSSMRHGMPPELPIILLGRLAIDLTVAGGGYGSGLVRDAYHRANQVANEIGVTAVVVDAMTDGLVSYYERLGFRSFSREPRRMYVRLKAIRRLLAEQE